MFLVYFPSSAVSYLSLQTYSNRLNIHNENQIKRHQHLLVTAYSCGLLWLISLRKVLVSSLHLWDTVEACVLSPAKLPTRKITTQIRAISELTFEKKSCLNNVWGDTSSWRKKDFWFGNCVVFFSTRCEWSLVTRGLVILSLYKIGIIKDQN